MARLTPLLVGIAGGSASGKTWLADGLVHRLGPDRALLLSHDRYYRALPPGVPAEAWNFDEPAALETDLLVAHLEQLRAGAPVRVPLYAYAQHARVGLEEVHPRPIIVVEGLFLLAEPSLAALLDLRVFVDTPAEVRLARRVERDVGQRGRTPEAVHARFHRHVEPMHLRHVAPSRALAHLVVDGREPRSRNVDALLARLPIG